MGGGGDEDAPATRLRLGSNGAKVGHVDHGRAARGLNGICKNTLIFEIVFGC